MGRANTTARSAPPEDATGPPADRVAVDRDALVRDNRHLVKWVMGTIAPRLPRYADWDDLWAAGLCGLVEASRRFDPGSGVPFAGYAHARIRGAILDAARAADWASRGLRRDLRTIDEATRRLRQEMAADPSDADVAAATGLSTEMVRRRLRERHEIAVVHLDQPVTRAAGAPTVGAGLPDERGHADPAAAVEELELIGSLRLAVEHLPPRLREIILRHYFHGERFTQIAKGLRVTPSRVSQLHTEGLNALRAHFAAERCMPVEEVVKGSPGARRRASFVADMARRGDLHARLASGRRPTHVARSA